MNIRQNLTNARGFTLLEILVAVVILAMSFTVLLTQQSSSLRMNQRAIRNTEVAFLARQKLTEVEIKIDKDMHERKIIDESSESGKFEEPFDEYSWQIDIKKVEFPPIGDDPTMNFVIERMSKAMRLVQVTISWGDEDLPADKRPHFTVSTHVVDLKGSL